MDLQHDKGVLRVISDRIRITEAIETYLLHLQVKDEKGIQYEVEFEIIQAQMRKL
jgi:hypothetical protein